MTFSNNFVVEVKVKGKILRVKDGVVYLPFGSEYHILLKNLDTRRSSINISIDGSNVLDGSSLVLDSNKSTELQGFLKGNIATNSFKFIQKTEKIQDYRGDKVDDGMIRVTFAYEKIQPAPYIKSIIHEVHHHDYYHVPVKYDYYRGFGNADWTYFSTNGSGDFNSKNSSDSLCVGAAMSNKIDLPLADEGITVQGSEVNQYFNYTSIGELEEEHVIILRLKGITEDKETVQQAITVDTKFICKSCGIKSKSSFKFCPECGTFLS